MVHRIPEDTLKQNLKVVREELLILKQRAEKRKDWDSVQRLENSVRLLEKWY